MIKHTGYEQGSEDWAIARSGIPTASEFSNLVTPEFEIRKGQMPTTYLAEKVAEAWQGGPLLKFNTVDMDLGRLLEGEAIPWFEIAFEKKIERVGLCTTDDGRIGCSPDGLIGEDSGIEIKCPRVDTQVGYLLDGGVPKAYAAQVQGAMFVTGRPQWTFMSYCRHFPVLVLKVERDEAAQEAIAEALELFLSRFDRAMARLIEINGGPPPHLKPKPQPVMRPHDPDDVIP